jgi:amino-acid N-acetyltransferase
MNVEPAKLVDLGEIKGMLKQCGLPHEDIQMRHRVHFFIVREEASLVGTVGLELLGEAALLRSTAVAVTHRGRGLGEQLVRCAEDHARKSRVSSLYLLTTTAQGFFTKIGYHVIERSTAPPLVQQTSEFAGICPSSSICLAKFL